MIVVITVDPPTGRVSMMSEGGDPRMIRMALQAMCDDLDSRFNNGEPLPRPSGLIVPANSVPAPPTAASPNGPSQ